MGDTERRGTGASTAGGPHDRSSVVLVDRDDEPHRPFVVLNTDRLPNAGEQYVGAPITTERTEDAIALDPDHWTEGAMDRRSYVLASDVSSFYHWTIEARIGALSDRATDVVARRVARYVGAIE